MQLLMTFDQVAQESLIRINDRPFFVSALEGEQALVLTESIPQDCTREGEQVYLPFEFNLVIDDDGNLKAESPDAVVWSDAANVSSGSREAETVVLA